MDKTRPAGRKQFWPSSRRLVQLYCALLYNAHLRGFVDGKIYQGRAKYACVPGLHCYSCPGSVGSCPLGALQNALGASSHRAGWYILGVLLLFGVMLGRTVCGWLCPLGLLQELLHKIPTPKIRKGRVTRALSWLKYVVLAVFVLAIPLWFGLREGTPLPAFCKYICPAGTLEGAMGLLSNSGNASLWGMLGQLFTQKWVILVLPGLACVFVWRAFCRFLCPLGAIYSLFNRFNLIGVRVDADRCNGCGACVRKCGMDIRHVGDRECIHCAQCVDACARGAISLRAGRIVLAGPETEASAPKERERHRRGKRIFQGAALALLCFALVWFNLLDPSLRTAESASAPEAATAQETASAMETASAQEDAPASWLAAAGTRQPGSAASAQETASAQESPSAQEDAPASWLAAAGTQQVPAASPTPEAPVGCEVGQQLPDFTLSCYDGSLFRLSEHRGRVILINLWATYCTPCVRELPYFDALLRQHPEEISVLAVHSSLVTEDPAAWLEGRGYALSFATDTEDQLIWRTVDAPQALPLTLVLDARGRVVYRQAGSVTPEMLEALYEKARSGEAPVAEKESASSQREYTITVADQTGAPVPGVKINCCGETFCVLRETDKNGVIRFTDDSASPHLEIILLPGGYRTEERELSLPAGENTLTVTVIRD